VITGKGIAFNVILPIEILNGIDIGKSHFFGRVRLSSDKD